ncbi:MAG: hypothetical protein G01um101438_453 [Parcubacteria group bacterium Gr01-1014_38]|nr:MAG: hypothetical protein G01um101438_453 [Parcubacteria group bacterium Gr01-1014_38]
MISLEETFQEVLADVRERRCSEIVRERREIEVARNCSKLGDCPRDACEVSDGDRVLELVRADTCRCQPGRDSGERDAAKPRQLWCLEKPFIVVRTGEFPVQSVVDAHIKLPVNSSGIDPW